VTRKKTKKKRASYPEHAKLHAVALRSQTCGEFLEWLTEEKNLFVCRIDGENVRGPNYVPVSLSPTRLLAEFFEIDQDKIGAEKDAMVAELRAMNEGATDA